MKTLSVEGLDKVGKHTSFLATTKKLLQNNYKVILADFPQYWFFGHFVKINLNTKSFENIISGYKEIEIRCLFYSLDRLLSLITVDNLKSEDSYLLTDRGWASNAVTIGYGLAQNIITKNEAEILKDKMTEFDEVFIRQLQPTSVLLDVGNDGTSAHARGLMEREDLYEQELPQKLSEQIYKESLQLPIVYTQINNSWRNPEDIASDILNQVEIKNSDNKPFENFNKYLTSGQLKIAGPNNFYPIIYGEEWNNHDELKNLSTEWIDIFLTGDKNDLKLQDKKIIDYVVANPPKKLYFRVDPAISEYLKKVFTQYSEILPIVEKATNENFIKFFKSLAEN